MSRLSWWKRGGFVVGTGLATLATLAGGPRDGRSAEPPGPSTAQAPASKNFYTGSRSCQACHNYPPDSATNPYNAYAEGFIHFNEYDTWKNKDKHSLAYANLEGKRGQEMAARLGVDVKTREAGCLGCHSAGPAELADRQDRKTLYDRSEGVSCENCHGPSSNWTGPHTLASFRTDESAKAQFGRTRAEFGLVELRKPEQQAEQCLSCHIGNIREEKVVTHAMYAAGHPPLPSIEVATFGDQIPRHWFLPSERDAKYHEDLGTKPGQKDRTKLAIVGAAVALRTSMRLVADEARGDAKTKAPGQAWPDYARFDCYACHHALKRDSWRQERGYQGPPGRPLLNEWPMAIVELGIERLMLDDPAARSLKAELHGHRRAILDPIHARPFGKRAAVAKAAEEFAAWSEVLIARLSAASFDANVTRRLLRRLVETYTSATERVTLDYDAARHVGWAIEVLIRDLGPDFPRLAEIKPILAVLRDKLELDLPAGRDTPIEGNLPRSLAKASDYDPASFREQLNALAGLLPPE